MSSFPERIVSLVPSQTELLSHLGLDEQIIGITKFCVHPEHIYRSKPRVGGTKDLHLDRILSLEPDLVIANKEENEKEAIETLMAEGIRVHVTDVFDLDSALDMIQEVGRITGTADRAQGLAQEIGQSFQNLNESTQDKQVLYLIWRDPWMSVGIDTFIHDMIMRCGWANCMAPAQRYPEVKPEDCNPDIVLLSSEPYPFKEKHLEEVQNLWPDSIVRLVDGEYFSWYGSRLMGTPKYLKQLTSELST